MSIRCIPLITGFLPIVAIHASLLLAVGAGVIPVCFPYTDGCASISATGRYEPAAFLFKPAMTVEAVLMVVYWILNAAWLTSMKRTRSSATGMSAAGIIGAAALVVYVTFLGTQTPFYEFMRRFGIYFYFLFTVVAQIMLASYSIRIGKRAGLPKVVQTSRIQFWFALTPFGLGVINLVLKVILADPDEVENAIEWTAALMMHVFFLLSYLTWRETGFEATCRVNDYPARKDR